MREFNGLSDFFLNATEEEKIEIYSIVMKEATNEQLRVMEKLDGEDENGTLSLV